MSYSVGPELQEYIASKVTKGDYQNQSEVVRDALRRMKRDDEIHQARVAELNREIELGARQLDRGERVSALDSKRRRAALLEVAAEIPR